LPLTNVALMVPQEDPLRTPVDRGGPIPQSGRRPSRRCHARETSTADVHNHA